MMSDGDPVEVTLPPGQHRIKPERVPPPQAPDPTPRPPERPDEEEERT